PAAALPPKTREAKVRDTIAEYALRHNHEAHSPPVFYAIYGAWYRLGTLCGLQGQTLLYWTRCLNVLVYAALVVLSYFFVRRFFPQRTILAWSVTSLLAVFPQDVFFVINSDVLSPLFFLTALFFIAEWTTRDRPAATWSILAGAAAALT